MSRFNQKLSYISVLAFMVLPGTSAQAEWKSHLHDDANLVEAVGFRTSANYKGYFIKQDGSIIGYEGSSGKEEIQRPLGSLSHEVVQNLVKVTNQFEPGDLIDLTPDRPKGTGYATFHYYIRKTDGLSIEFFKLMDGHEYALPQIKSKDLGAIMTGIGGLLKLTQFKGE